MQLFPVHTIADAVGIDRKLDPAAVEALLTDHSPGLKVLAAPVQPEAQGPDQRRDGRPDPPRPQDQFDFVVVDTPPAFDDVVLQSFDESDLLLLIGTLDVPALKSLKITSETLGLLNHPRDKWRLVLNRADMKVGLTPDEVEKTLDLPIHCAIPQSNDVPGLDQPGPADRPRNRPVTRSRQSFRRLARRLRQGARGRSDRKRRAQQSPRHVDALRRSVAGLLRRRS